MSLNHILSTVIYYFCKVLCGTISFHPKKLDLEDHIIISVWHEDILLLSLWALKSEHNFSNFSVVISQHRDADLAIKTLKKLRLNIIRGSTTRGYVGVVRYALKSKAPLVIISDGPRGPPRILKKGVLSLAKKTGRKLVHVKFSDQRVIRLPTWDKLKLPIPFSKYTLTAQELV